MDKIDICIVAACRPALLAQTLESFSEKIFRNFKISGVYVNIDPIFGSEEEGAATEAALKSFFPDAVIRRPQFPSFGTAVKHVWQVTTAPYIFHLEDDWAANQNLGPEEIGALFETPSTAQVSLNHFYKNWDFKRGEFHENKKTYRVLGMRLKWGAPRPYFTTSPSFLRGEFARRSAKLMDPQFDPEKQFYTGVNKPLEQYASRFRNFIYGKDRPFVISDTGREWRDSRKIAKSIVNSTSVWTARE